MLTQRFISALGYAAQLHYTQRRKGSSVPYVSHLLGVASIVLDHGGNEDEAIAALLHDAVEDQGGQKTAEDIRTRFGPVVHEIVMGCSDTDVVPKPPWRERKENYLLHVRSASPSIKLVSAADKLHNARSIVLDLRTLGDAVFEKFNASRKETLWYYRSLVPAYREGGTQANVACLVDELERTVTELHRLAGEPLS